VLTTIAPDHRPRPPPFWEGGGEENGRGGERRGGKGREREGRAVAAEPGSQGACPHF